MNRDEIGTCVRSCIEEVAPDADVSSAGPDDDLIQDLELDSMDVLGLAEAIHVRIGVEIPERDYPKLRTMTQFVDYLATRVT